MDQYFKNQSNLREFWINNFHILFAMSKIVTKFQSFLRRSN
jgi:hypothetical protein